MTAQRGGETFKLAATLNEVEVGQDFEGTAHMTFLRWFHAPKPWRTLESRLQYLFEQPDPFIHPDAPEGPKVQGSALYGPDANIPVFELGGVSRWPNLGAESLVRSLEGEHTDEPFAHSFDPHITKVPDLKLRKGQRVQFSSVAVVRRNEARTEREVIFTVPIINTRRKRS
jgi:hypothetical protein